MRRAGRRTALAALLVAAAAWLGAPSASAAAFPPLAPTPSALAPEQAAWVEETLARLTLEEKAAQTVGVRVNGLYAHPDSPAMRELRHLVGELGVGNLVLFRSELETVPRLLDELQGLADVPLLVSADAERGMGFRIDEGTVSLPYAMAVGATRSEEAARFLGEVTAREGRALGIHWALAPVADVNNDPANPVINLRSFGEDPALVARLVAAFVEGAHAGGMMTSVKHFPGHGDTGVDSHRELPVIAVDRARLDAVELAPFRAAIAAGTDSVMVGHIAVPALDPSGAPATLSPAIGETLLRDELGFAGLVVTDALEMDGLSGVWTGEAAIRALQAGADMLLLPEDPDVAVASVARAVREGVIPEERLDASVRRILAAKARLGLHRERRVGSAALQEAVGRPADVLRADAVAGAAITALRNEGGVLPLHADGPVSLLHVILGGGPGDPGTIEDAIEAHGVPVVTARFGREVSPESEAATIAAAADASHVIVSAFVRVSPDPEKPAFSPSQARLLAGLTATGKPVILASFGSPYLLGEAPGVAAALVAYGPAAASQRAAAAALFGERAVGGLLPVTLPEIAAVGEGLAIPAYPMTLEPASATEAGFRPEGLAEIDRILDDFVAQGAFPGGVVAVGHQGKFAHLRAFGRQTYDPASPAVTPDTLYDLASLTKVIATTSMAMILVDEGRLDLDEPVQDFLPGFVGPGKEKVTVRHLLTHSSGLDWWAPLYEELSGQEAYVARIQEMPLVYEPGTETKYSDLGLILLGEILERVAGEPLESFVRRRVFEPLGMDDTRYRPPAALLGRIAPTEVDPWRGRLVHGEVHDENAFALGGVAPHAGLFGTAPDLARFAQTILNGGVYAHHRLARRTTVDHFTTPAGIVPGSTRALGWDTKSPEGSSAGSLFSPDSFGHTGFTGTSLWIDPERELFVILLTNRVHPTRENQLIREARPAVADAVVRALIDPGPTRGEASEEETPEGALEPVHP